MMYRVAGLMLYSTITAGCYTTTTCLIMCPLSPYQQCSSTHQYRTSILALCLKTTRTARTSSVHITATTHAMTSLLSRAELQLMLRLLSLLLLRFYRHDCTLIGGHSVNVSLTPLSSCSSAVYASNNNDTCEQKHFLINNRKLYIKVTDCCRIQQSAAQCWHTSSTHTLRMSLSNASYQL
jgi:hypothetical protein